MQIGHPDLVSPSCGFAQRIRAPGEQEGGTKGCELNAQPLGFRFAIELGTPGWRSAQAVAANEGLPRSRRFWQGRICDASSRSWHGVDLASSTTNRRVRPVCGVEILCAEKRKEYPRTQVNGFTDGATCGSLGANSRQPIF